MNGELKHTEEDFQGKTDTTETKHDVVEILPIPPQPERMPVVRQLALLGLVLLCAFSLSTVPRVIANLRADDVGSRITDIVDRSEEEGITMPDLSVFSEVTISGSAAFVWDVATQRILYEKDPDAQLPIASITKLMTTLVAHEILARETTISIPMLALLQDGDSGLRDGERFSFDALSDLTLMSSSNDGAYALAAAAGALLSEDDPAETFVEAMNIRAQELGLTQTYFRNPTGLDISETEAGAYSSARDVAFLLEYIVREKPEILEATTEIASIFYNTDGAYHEADNTNAVVRDIPGLIASKTGYTALAGGNLAVAYDAGLNRPIIIVVLGSTYTERFDDVLELVEASRASVQ